MADLRVTRKKLRTVFIALAVLDVLLLGLWFSPWGHASATKQDEIKQLGEQATLKMQQMGPYQGMDQKVTEARAQLTSFYSDRLPGEQSAILEQLGKIAADHQVKLSQAKYDEKSDEEAAGLQPVAIEASLDGSYLSIAKFINSVERSKMFFLVDSVNLGESQGGNIKLRVKMETFRRVGTQTPAGGEAKPEKAVPMSEPGNKEKS